MNQQENAALAERAARRALYSSLFSIVACAIMLFGTTFAWFTANQTSGVSTMTAASFDVTFSQTEFDTAGSHTVTLTRIGGGTSPGYCRFTLTLSGEYNKTQTVTYSDGTPGDSTEETVELNEEKNCFAHFSGDADESVTFTLNLTNATARIDDVTVSWDSSDSSGGNSTVVLRGPRLLSAKPRPETIEITDGMCIDFGMEDQSIDVPASEAQEAEKLAAEEAAKAEQLAIEAAANAAQQPEAQTTTDDTQTTMNGDNNDGGNDNDNADTGTGNDGNGSGAGGSTGESSGGEGGGNVSGGESSGSGDAGNGDAGTGDAGTGDAGSAGNAAEGGQT